MQTQDIFNQFHLDGSPYKIAIVASNFYPELTQELITNTKEELIKNGVKEKNINVSIVSGCLEIPYICKRIIGFRKTDIIITLGLVVRGETSHYDLVNNTTYEGIMKVQLDSGTTPIIFGVLTCENMDQAIKRVKKDQLNKGKSFAQSAILQEHIVRNKL